MNIVAMNGWDVIATFFIVVFLTFLAVVGLLAFVVYKAFEEE